MVCRYVLGRDIVVFDVLAVVVEVASAVFDHDSPKY